MVSRIIAGLGNPGREYLETRHNVGFMAIEELSGRLETGFGRKRFNALVGRAKIAGIEVLMMMPQTFMNLSGESVAKAASFYRIPPQQIIIIHDDLDFDLGTVRIKKGGGDGGHKGVASVIECLGDDSFVRVRIGIGRPEKTEEISHVLSEFSKLEIKTKEEAIKRASDAVLSVIKDGLEPAMNTYNKRRQKE